MPDRDTGTPTPSRIGYYVAAGDQGQIRLMWCERCRTPTGTEPGRQLVARHHFPRHLQG